MKIDVDKINAMIGRLHAIREREKTDCNHAIVERITIQEELLKLLPDILNELVALQTACIEYEIRRQKMCLGERKTDEELLEDAKRVLTDRGLL